MMSFEQRMKWFLRRVIIVFVTPFLFFLSSCATQHLNGSSLNGTGPDAELSIIRSVTYDENGLPQFDDILAERPDDKGASFTLVDRVNGHPRASYDIAIIDGVEPDLVRPLEVIYEWTGRGFIGGLRVTEDWIYYTPSHGSASGDDALVSLGFVFAPMLVGTAGGFVVGLFACIPEAVQEIGHILIDKKEVLVSFTEYEYDELDRLERTRTFNPSDPPVEIIRTEFIYTAEERIPEKTRVTSYPEGAVRVIE